jgi:hypothetical protein
VSNIGMELSDGARSRTRRVTIAALFLISAFSSVWLVRCCFRVESSETLAPSVSAVALVAASALLFWKSRFGYLLAAISAALSLQWFSKTELPNFPALNSWTLFNLQDNISSLADAKPRVIFASAMIASTICSLVALLPANWLLQGKPIRERLWPGFALAFVLVGVWYLKSVSPYRVPIIVDGPSPELAILHIEKNGLRFVETEISVYRNGEYYFSRNHRTLFQYRFAVRGGQGVLPPELSSEVKNLAASPVIQTLYTGDLEPIRAWRSEGWYVRTGRKFSAFTSERWTEPPKQAVELFQALMNAAHPDKPLPDGKDICFGFCYDPLAGLGFEAFNDRCGYNNGTRCE